MPSGRWIVNFDIDLVDSIVLGTVLGAYCPFLVRKTFLNQSKFDFLIFSLDRTSFTTYVCSSNQW